MKMHEKIKSYREMQGLKQNFVEFKAGLKPKRLSALEKGQIKLTVDEFERICVHGFEVSPCIFFNNIVLETKSGMEESSTLNPNSAA